MKRGQILNAGLFHVITEGAKSGQGLTLQTAGSWRRGFTLHFRVGRRRWKFRWRGLMRDRDWKRRFIYGRCPDDLTAAEMAAYET